MVIMTQPQHDLNVKYHHSVESFTLKSTLLIKAVMALYLLDSLQSRRFLKNLSDGKRALLAITGMMDICTWEVVKGFRLDQLILLEMLLDVERISTKRLSFSPKMVNILVFSRMCNWD